jgi:hypothetical protein
MPPHHFRLPPKGPIRSLVCTNRRCDFMKAREDCHVSKCPACGSALQGLDIPLPRETPRKAQG